MAISRHDPEWKRVVAMAALGGVTFTTRRETPAPNRHVIRWFAHLPDGRYFHGNSKFHAACIAVYGLGGDPKLPDAASPQTAPSGPDGTELRSS